MQDRVRMAVGGAPGTAAGRSPEDWVAAAVGEVGEIADSVAGRSFLYEDPSSYRAGVRDLLRALVASGSLPVPA